jgi:hypothetical protein
MSKVNLDLDYKGFEDCWFSECGNDIIGWRQITFRFKSDTGLVVRKHPDDTEEYKNDEWVVIPCMFVGNHEDPYDDMMIMDECSRYRGDSEAVREVLKTFKEIEESCKI